VPATEGGGRHTQPVPAEHRSERRPAGLDQHFRGSVDESPMDPSMLQDGNSDPMNLDLALYPEADALEFEYRPELDGPDGHASARRGRRPAQKQGLQDGVFGSGDQAQWTRWSGDVDGETLPWPGTLAAVYQDMKLPTDRTKTNQDQQSSASAAIRDWRGRIPHDQGVHDQQFPP